MKILVITVLHVVPCGQHVSRISVLLERYEVLLCRLASTEISCTDRLGQ